MDVLAGNCFPQPKIILFFKEEEMEKRSLWKFGTREVVYAAIGAALYAVLGVATNFIQIPSAGNVAFRPAVAIPLFFGIAFGPIVGFIAGFLGNMITDLISGYGFWFWWDLGNGLMGLVAGLMAFSFVSFKARSTLLKAELYVILGVLVGMGVASISEMWVSGADINTVIYGNFIPSVVANLINGLILVPILMIAYDAVVSRSGR
jgi:energy-coupling factor transport system substrate-specific component